MTKDNPELFRFLYQSCRVITLPHCDTRHVEVSSIFSVSYLHTDFDGSRFESASCVQLVESGDSR